MTAKEVKEGDVVYAVKSYTGPEKITVSKITHNDNSFYMKFSNGCISSPMIGNEICTTMSLYSCRVYFSIEDAIQYYERQIEEFKVYIENLRIQNI